MKCKMICFLCSFTLLFANSAIVKASENVQYRLLDSVEMGFKVEVPDDWTVVQKDNLYELTDPESTDHVRQSITFHQVDEGDPFEMVSQFTSEIEKNSSGVVLALERGDLSGADGYRALVRYRVEGENMFVFQEKFFVKTGKGVFVMGYKAPEITFKMNEDIRFKLINSIKFAGIKQSE